MNTAMIVWLSVAAILLILFVIRIFEERAAGRSGSRQSRQGRRIKIIELGKEDEEFFIPGDNAATDNYDRIYN